MVIGLVPAGVGNGPVDIVRVVGFFLPQYCPDMKATVLRLLCHKPCQKRLGFVTECEELLPDRFQAIAHGSWAMDTLGIKGYHRSGLEALVPYDQGQFR